MSHQALWDSRQYAIDYQQKKKGGKVDIFYLPENQGKIHLESLSWFVMIS